MDNAQEIDGFYEVMGNKSGGDRRMIEEIKEQKCMHAIIYVIVSSVYKELF